MLVGYNIRCIGLPADAGLPCYPQLLVTWVVLLVLAARGWWPAEIPSHSLPIILFFKAEQKIAWRILPNGYFKSPIPNSCSCFNFWSQNPVSLYEPFFAGWVSVRVAIFCLRISSVVCKTENCTVANSAMSSLFHLSANRTGFRWALPMMQVKYLFFVSWSSVYCYFVALLYKFGKINP